MKGAVVRLQGDAEHDLAITDLYPFATYNVMTVHGPSAVTINDSIIFSGEKIGFEWYVIRRKTRFFRTATLVNKAGELRQIHDPLFICELVACSPTQKNFPSRRRGKPMRLGMRILMTGSLLAAKLAHGQSTHPKGGSNLLPPSNYLGPCFFLIILVKLIRPVKIAQNFFKDSCRSLNTKYHLLTTYYAQHEKRRQGYEAIPPPQSPQPASQG